MNLRLTWLVTVASTLAMLACQPSSVPMPVDATDSTQATQIPGNPVDSTQIVQFVDVKLVAAQSVIPKGALDQLVRKASIQYSPPAEVYKDSTITQFLYNAAGQITGYQDFFLGNTGETEREKIVRQSAYGVVYEYKNNRPYRIYSKTYNSMVNSYQDLFFMSQFGYVNESTTKPKFKWEYRVSPTGKATLLAQSELVYDQTGNLIESKDVKKYFVHQRYTYQGGNIVKNETIDPKPTSIQHSHYEYEYDKQVNPTKDLFWNGNYDFTEFTGNANNVIQRRLVDSNPSFKTYIDDYTMGYDGQGRIVSRSTGTNSSSTQWLYRYGK